MVQITTYDEFAAEARHKFDEILDESRADIKKLTKPELKRDRENTAAFGAVYAGIKFAGPSSGTNPELAERVGIELMNSLTAIGYIDPEKIISEYDAELKRLVPPIPNLKGPAQITEHNPPGQEPSR